MKYYRNVKYPVNPLILDILIQTKIKLNIHKFKNMKYYRNVKYPVNPLILDILIQTKIKLKIH
jgi:hypothetical protein